MSIVQVDPTSEVSVTTLLENARTWIAQAVENSTPLEIAFAKAQIATAAEATKQLGLSKEIQLDAQEMVRRAEYALGKAIRKGQAEGTVNTRADGGWSARNLDVPEEGKKMTPADLLGAKRTTTDVYVMTDGVAPDAFDTAIRQAKAEGNLSRANVVRKVKGDTLQPQTRDGRADLIEDLAAQGYSTRQMPSKVGITEQAIRDIIRDYKIDVPAERSVGRTRRHDSARIASETVIALEGLVLGVELIDYAAIDPDQASQWVDSLDHSLRVLNRFRKQIKETTQ